MKTVVITGFGPFGSFSSNPTTDVVNQLKTEGIPDFDGKLVLETMTVAYEEVTSTVNRLHEEYKPDVIIHLGASAQDHCIKLEKQAFSDGYCRYDVNKCIPFNNVCPADGETTLCTEIDCQSICDVINSTVNLPVLVMPSDDPGRYLCGFSYYLSLSKNKRGALFVHIPPFDHDYTLDNVTQVIRLLVKEIVSRL